VERRLGLDVLKGISILLVVFNHALLWPMRSGDLPSAFLYGTAFGTVAAFSAVAGYVQGLHPPREEWAVLRKRAGQLLVPWALWAPLYAAAPLAWRAVGGGALPMEFDPGPWAREILLGGGPLWFLPVLFVSTAICAFLDTRTDSWTPAWVALGVYAVLAASFSIGNTSPLDLGNGTFWMVAPLYVASYWFGLRISRDGPPGISHGVLATVAAASMIASGVVTLYRATHPSERWLMWLPYAIGVLGGLAALVIAAGTRHRPRGLVLWLGTEFARIGRASLGLYILHPVMVAPIALYAHGRGGVWVAALTTGVVFLAGTPMVERARKVPVLRRFV
jgi:fucose 4-O-acetylase-like acetyltransferase